MVRMNGFYGGLEMVLNKIDNGLKCLKSLGFVF